MSRPPTDAVWLRDERREGRRGIKDGSITRGWTGIRGRRREEVGVAVGKVSPEGRLPGKVWTKEDVSVG